MSTANWLLFIVLSGAMFAMAGHELVVRKKPLWRCGAELFLGGCLALALVWVAIGTPSEDIWFRLNQISGKLKSIGIMGLSVAAIGACAFLLGLARVVTRRHH